MFLILKMSRHLCLLHLEDCSSASWTSSVLTVGLDDRRVRVDQGHLGLGEGLLEAGLAVDLVVGAVVGILLGGVQEAVTLGAVEALLVPVMVLGHLSLGLEDLRGILSTLL